MAYCSTIQLLCLGELHWLIRIERGCHVQMTSQRRRYNVTSQIWPHFTLYSQFRSDCPCCFSEHYPIYHTLRDECKYLALLLDVFRLTNQVEFYFGPAIGNLLDWIFVRLMLRLQLYAVDCSLTTQSNLNFYIILTDHVSLRHSAFLSRNICLSFCLN